MKRETLGEGRAVTEIPFSQPWADVFCAVINADPSYRRASRGWTWPIAFVLEANPEFGYPADAALRLDLDGGNCREIRAGDPASLGAPMSLRGAYSVWKDIVRGLLDPVTAVATGKLQLQGSLMQLMTQKASAKALVACAQRVPTRFPDEVPL